MSFLIYSKENNECKKIAKTSLGGNKLKQIWESKSKPKGYWFIKKEEWFKINHPDLDPNTHALITDIHPNQETTTLMEIKEMHLYTYLKNSDHFWSLLLVVMNPVYEGDKKHKDFFKIDKKLPESVYTFLYVKSDWNWSSNKINGALIYSDARKHFNIIINP